MLQFTIVLPLLLSTSLAGYLRTENQWKQFKLSHNKVYNSLEEEAHRLGVFGQNLKNIEEHNKKYKAGEATWRMGVNQFADMTSEEFLKYISNSDISLARRGNIAETYQRSYLTTYYPSRVDLRGYLNRVRDQSGCQCCYAISAITAIEASYAQKERKRVSLSTQNIIDCTMGNKYNNSGCNRGYVERSLDYIKDEGIMSEEDYPFIAANGTCKFNASKSVLKLKDYINVTNDEHSLAGALNEKGVFTILVDAKEWQFYDGGVFQPFEPFNNLTHAVVMAGYGRTSYLQTPYWILRNSWGEWWGEDGDIRLGRKFEGNYHIGIGAGNLSMALYPIL